MEISGQDPFAMASKGGLAGVVARFVDPNVWQLMTALAWGGGAYEMGMGMEGEHREDQA